ncbi:GDP-fucose synthetase [Rhizobium sullae]|uniref:GDP-L-fucose synthase n=1 Tax=Rhizobium sullae TaxID=50338 RepID=A0A2N0D1G4_RHISU|nr:GDP-L-fucose synthase [Rhizobium sullae]PKA39955.1 GDP-fucose synthetase [Rhizobium sullae]
MPKMFELSGKRIWVAGHRGMVGAALVRRLSREDCEILTVDRSVVDLRDQADVHSWVLENRPDVVLLAAAKVGGILANDTYPAEFLYDNLILETNVIHASHHAGVEKLLFLGSSCIYPKYAEQPIREDALLSGVLEPTNEWYAIAKIAGLKLCQAYRRQYRCDYISAMPTNLYGPGDNYDLDTSHVIPALIRKAHEAKVSGRELEIWGTGKPLREFLYVDDCADACVHLLKHYSEDTHVNVGSGTDISIRDLAGLIAEVVGFRGDIIHDFSKPDGTPRKLMSAEKIKALGWSPTVSLRAGLTVAYQAFLQDSSSNHQRSA